MSSDEYVGQYYQDAIIDHYFFKKTHGTFVDIGAYDGKTLSNTYFLEHKRNWRGICIEPIPTIFEKLCQNRPNSLNVNCLVGAKNDNNVSFLYVVDNEMLSGRLDKYHVTHQSQIDMTKTESIICSQLTLNDILDATDLTTIDVLSIDTEGSEYDIISAIDFHKYQFNMILVENPYTHINDCPIKKHLFANNYIYIGRIVIDDMYIHRTLRRPNIQIELDDVSAYTLFIHQDENSLITFDIKYPRKYTL